MSTANGIDRVNSGRPAPVPSPIIRRSDLEKLRSLGNVTPIGKNGFTAVMGVIATSAIKGILREVAGSNSYTVNSRGLVVNMPTRAIGEFIDRLNEDLDLNLYLPTAKQAAEIARLETPYLTGNRQLAGFVFSRLRTQQLRSATQNDIGLVLVQTGTPNIVKFYPATVAGVPTGEAYEQF